ncbi:hypothetical protein OHC33_009475 [Knufia fluminis]|uniref:Heterokaryon incompatibility domain-containing protein n=1 Tax=Knufia fluminis TaxID=191047 RepID=A0AAN8EPS5_9EURO|nr:hypothetical protein OHC33_009475 [Knufia fluminis]
MRLINTSTLQLEDFKGQSTPKYAILSHRWQAPSEEVSFADFNAGRKRLVGGWFKIKDCCHMALLQDLQYCWIDTCCINKDSSAEESRSINSMYAWYGQAAEAFVYLDDVHCSSIASKEEINELSNSRWFTRGWTLQELIAPQKVTFFNSSWEPLGTQIDLCSHLEKITSIPEGVLCNDVRPNDCSVAQRMFWAADRETTEVEDEAYCLIGLFDVNMPLIYGEGEKAFIRLQEEIIQRSTDQTIFAWSDEDSNEKGVLAPSPKCFKNKYSNGLREVSDYFPDDPAGDSFRLGNAGLLIDFVLIPWAMNTYLAPLRCYASGPVGADPTQRLCLILRRTKMDGRYVRIRWDDADLVLHRYLRVPKDPNSSYWDRSALHRQILIARSPLMVIKDCLYGFIFNFWSPTLFEAGSKPGPKDVVAEHVWDRNVPQLRTPHGSYRIAGIFRLSGQRLKDFNPFCLIASPPFDLLRSRLPLLNVKREIIDPPYLAQMSGWERSSWLDAMYLHKLLDEIVRVARKTPGDWNDNCVELGLLLGERTTTEQVFELPQAKLKVIFKLVESVPEIHWRVTFKDHPDPHWTIK